MKIKIEKRPLFILIAATLLIVIIPLGIFLTLFFFVYFPPIGYICNTELENKTDEKIVMQVLIRSYEDQRTRIKEVSLRPQSSKYVCYKYYENDDQIDFDKSEYIFDVQIVHDNTPPLILTSQGRQRFIVDEDK